MRTPDEIVSSPAFRKVRYAYQRLSKEFCAIAHNYNIPTDKPSYEIQPNRERLPRYKLRITSQGDELLLIDAALNEGLRTVSEVLMYVNAPRGEDVLKDYTRNYFAQRKSELGIDLLGP